jgi:hypothetical protein
MISPQGSTMTRIDLCDQLFAARSHEDRPAMPSFNFGPRTELTELRPRHLLMVEEYGFDVHGFDRNALGDYFLANWYRMFGPLRRSNALEVPSDSQRKEIMVSRLPDLIEMRRAEYAAERSRILTTSNI